MAQVYFKACQYPRSADGTTSTPISTLLPPVSGHRRGASMHHHTSYLYLAPLFNASNYSIYLKSNDAPYRILFPHLHLLYIHCASNRGPSNCSLSCFSFGFHTSAHSHPLLTSFFSPSTWLSFPHAYDMFLFLTMVVTLHLYSRPPVSLPPLFVILSCLFLCHEQGQCKFDAASLPRMACSYRSGGRKTCKLHVVFATHRTKRGGGGLTVNVTRRTVY